MRLLDFNNNCIFYTDKDFLISKKNNFITALKNNELVDETICPQGYKNFNIIENDNFICLFFVNGDIVLYDKQNYRFIRNEYNNAYGLIVSKVIKNKDNLCLFSTNLDKSIQIVQYDFLNNKRVSQSKSWKVNHVSDFCFNDFIYVVFDYVMLVSFDFEHNEIYQKFDNNGIKSLTVNSVPYYVSGKKIKKIVENKTEKVEIKDLYFDRILGSNNNSLFVSDANKKDVYGIDIKNNVMLWSLIGSFEIVDSCFFNNYLVICTTNNIICINLKNHKVDYIYKIPDIYRLITLKNNIICQHTSGNTFVLGD